MAFMKTLARSSIAILIIIALISIYGVRVFTEKPSLRIAGSTTVAPVVSRAAELFRKKFPDIRVLVNTGGSGVGVSGVGTYQIDVGMVSRDLTEQEKERYPKAGFQVHSIGRDGVACVISSEIRDAGIDRLTPDQIRKVYLGDIKNWKALGGPDRPIVVVDKEFHRGTRHVFMEYLFKNPQAKTPGTRLVTGSNNEEQAKIAQSDSAIGMLSLAWVNKDVVGLGIDLGDKTIFPTKETVSDGTYPITRDLKLVTLGSPFEITSRFIDFIKGPEGQEFVRKSGYVALSG